MQISTINETLLIRAATALVGQPVTDAIIALYLVLDKTSKEGYDLGKSIAEDGVEAAINEAWDHGFETGEAEADDAYIEGVADARARPAVADENIAYIMSAMTANALNGEYDVVGDVDYFLPDEAGYNIGG